MSAPWRVAVLALVLVVSLLAGSQPSAAVRGDPAATRSASTSTGISGYFNDMVLDVPRGRLYVSDSTTFHAQGVVVVNTTTQAQVGFLAVGSPTGLAISPDGQILAVATDNSVVVLVNPNTMQVVRSITVPSDSISNGYLWSVAFYTDAHLFVTLGQPYNVVGGTHSAYVFNTSTGSLEGGMSESLYGFYANAVVRIDAGRARAYVIDTASPSPVWVYDITNVSAIQRIAQWNISVDTDSVLAPDGDRFYASSGNVYDPLNFTLLGTTGDSGAPFIDASQAVLGYARNNWIDLVSLPSHQFLGRYGDRGYLGLAAAITPYVFNPAHTLAFVASAIAGNYDDLLAVPLIPGFVDPNPPDESVVPSLYWISVIVSGGLNPASLTMSVDNVSVSATYNASMLTLAYAPWPPQFPDGDYQVRVSGLSPTNVTLSLVWTFSLDTQPPQIIVHGVDTVYRTPHVTIYVTLVDPHLNLSRVLANGQPVTVNPANDTAAVDMNLQEGGNPLNIVATDTLYHTNMTFVLLLYVPPTTRYANATTHLSLEYPSDWTNQTDVTVNGTDLALVLRAPPTANGTPSANLIVGGPLAGYTVPDLLALVNASLVNLTQLPGFRLLEGPHAVAIPSLTAVTYSFLFTYGGKVLFERQYLAASAALDESWILTFAAASGDTDRYDPLFRWVAASMAPYTPSAGPAGPANPSSGLLVLIVSIIVAAAAVAAAVFLLWTRRPKAATPPPGTPAAPQAPEAPYEPPRPPAP